MLHSMLVNLVSGSGAAAAVSVFEDRFKANMEVRLLFFSFVFVVQSSWGGFTADAQKEPHLKQ